MGVLAMEGKEMDLYRKYSSSYGYASYIAKKTDE
jgi:hypothetical protein